MTPGTSASRSRIVRITAAASSTSGFSVMSNSEKLTGWASSSSRERPARWAMLLISGIAPTVRTIWPPTRRFSSSEVPGFIVVATTMLPSANSGRKERPRNGSIASASTLRPRLIAISSPGRTIAHFRARR